MVQVQFEKNIRRIRCDNGGKFTSNQMIEFYVNQGIILETSCTHILQQNGVVERKHRHLLETARALRFEANLPTRFWGECVLTAAHVINRMPSDVIDNKTPYEVLYNQKPNYDYMRVFGCLAYYKSIETKGEKFKMKGRQGVFLGYPPGTKVIEEKRKDLNGEPNETKIGHGELIEEFEDDFENHTKTEAPSEDQTEVEVGPEGSQDEDNEPTFNSDSGNFVEPLKRNITRPTYLDDYETQSFLSAITSSSEPKHFQQAIQDLRWIKAMKKEIQALEQDKTWTLEELPNAKRPLTPNGGETFIAILIYVDDVIIAGNKSEKIQEIKKFLHERFIIKDLGPLKFFLGIEVARTKEGMVLSHRKYTLDILTETRKIGCKLSAFPMEQNLRLGKCETDKQVDGNQYRRLIGDPRQSYMDAADHLFGYLKATPRQGILIPKGGGTNLTTYSYSDWIGCPIT
ncbi:putative RNA-directed DNA polymerase [Tanacetum coccineum]